MKALMLAALALGGCAATAAETRQADDRAARDVAKVDRALTGLTPGEPQTCLSNAERRNAPTQNFRSTVLFRVSRDLVYRNDMNGGCVGGGIDPIFVTRTPSTSLCRGDIAQLIDRVARFPVGACSYGEFVPYTRAR